MDGLALLEVEDEGPGPAQGEERLVFERFWRARPDGRGSGLGLAIVKATAERHGGRAFVDRLPVHDRAAGPQESFRERGHSGRRELPERFIVKTLRTLSTTRLDHPRSCRVHRARRRRGRRRRRPRRRRGDARPRSRSHRRRTTPSRPRSRDGVTARITFTNKLFPSGALVGQAGSALMSGATGRLWWNPNGGRLELQSDAGDVQLTWNDTKATLFDASSNTAYTFDLPQDKSGASTSTVATTPCRRSTRSRSSSPSSARTGRSRAPSRRTSPARRPTRSRSRPHTTAVCSARPSSPGPLRTACRCGSRSTRATRRRRHSRSRRRTSRSARSRTATVQVAPPATAKVVDLSSQTKGNGSDPTGGAPVTGLAAVQAAAGFPVAAPDTLVGLPRQDVRLVGPADSRAALVVYGQGLGAIVLVERAERRQGRGGRPAREPAQGLARAASPPTSSRRSSGRC